MASTYERRRKGRVGGTKLGFKMWMRDDETGSARRRSTASHKTDSICSIKPKKSIKANSASRCVYSERWRLVWLFSALKLSWMQNTSPRAGRHVSRYN